MKIGAQVTNLHVFIFIKTQRKSKQKSADYHSATNIHQKSPPLNFVIRLFKCFTIHLQISICYIHFSRVCRCCLFLQLNDIQCMHRKCNEHFHLGEQKLSCGQFSVSLAFGDWHIIMLVPKLRFTAKPCTYQDIQDLAVSHTCTHTDVYDSRKCMQ